MLTISLLVFSDLVGLMPNKHNSALEVRKQMSEALAIQLSQLAAASEFHVLESTLHAIVSRNKEILSAALRRSDGKALSEYGDHQVHWGDYRAQKSTLTHVRVPIIQGSRKWGVVEIRFADLYTGNLSSYLHHSLVGLVIFVGVFGFISYMLFLRRALKALDPSSVVPDRVRSAFDLMAEGIAILDEKGQLVLANAALAERLEVEPKDLLGKDLSTMKWRTRDSDTRFPWEESRLNKTRQIGMPLLLENGKDENDLKIFTVNSAPILDSKNNPRGVFITFDDMTVLEKKNNELTNALEQLTHSKAEIVRQNEELHYLATRDPMTGVLNRRALFESFNRLLSESRTNGEPLSAMMIDIDHFKLVNDTYGHAVGDQVIKMVARILEDQTREHDLVGRYGGEEFVVAMPGTSLDQAEHFAERIRKTILSTSETDAVLVKRLTASLGVSTLNEEIDAPDVLIDLADQALYQAKSSGRNRVVRSDQLRDDGAPAEEKHARDEKEQKKLLAKINKLKRLAADRKIALEQGLMYDADTGLPNRNLLKSRIVEAVARHRRQGGYGAVISLYINAYEMVVNAYGYEAANAFITNIAKMLHAHLRITDTVAQSDDGGLDFYRLGSAELGILLTDLSTKANVVSVLARIEKLLERPVEVNGTSFLPRAEMGVALHPTDGDQAEALLSNASAARNFTDQQPANHRFSFYSERMNELARELLTTEAELQKALEQDELELWYQPKVSGETGRISGLEALIRWRHPEHGIVFPDKFIPIAEQSDLINRLGFWVFKAAVKQLKLWAGTPLEGIRVAVNVSPRQFLDAHFIEHVDSIFQSHPEAAGKLDLELTEGVLLRNPDHAKNLMEKLAAQGMHLYLDDFGTGYASLNYLKHLPLHALKIDRSFTQEIVASQQERAIVSSIINVATGLNLGVVAEGVESEEQVQIMSDLGCGQFQGYYFSRPVPADEIVAIIEKTNVAA